MPRVVKPLTPTQVKQAKPKEKDYLLSDGRGLSLKVKPTGAKSWLFKYANPRLEKRSNIGFGAYPTVSLADARKRREEALELIAKGIDPKQRWDELKQHSITQNNNTLEKVARKWFSVKQTKVTPDYANDIIRSLEMHVLPTLGKTPVSELRAPATIAALQPLASKGSLETIKRVCQRLNEVMAYAANTGLIDANPLAGIRDAFEKPQVENLPALKPAELPELMRALSIASIRLVTRCLIEWQLHTMVRPGEAAQTRWDEIDLENALWHAPDETMKKKRAHKVPLTEQSLAILKLMRPISGHLEYIFPGDRNPKAHTHKQTANMALKRMGFGGRLVAHGMRSIASTTLNEAGFDPDLVEKSLAHIDRDEVRAAYNRAEYLERRRAMMNWWSQHIESAANGNMSLAATSKDLKSIG